MFEVGDYIVYGNQGVCRVEGIGPKRRKALMKYFKDIAKIKDASVEELCQVEGITKNVAEEIYHFFH